MISEESCDTEVMMQSKILTTPNFGTFVVSY